jgi:hypothetical protein
MECSPTYTSAIPRVVFWDSLPSLHDLNRQVISPWSRAQQLAVAQFASYSPISQASSLFRMGRAYSFFSLTA